MHAFNVSEHGKFADVGKYISMKEEGRTAEAILPEQNKFFIRKKVFRVGFVTFKTLDP